MHSVPASQDAWTSVIFLARTTQNVGLTAPDETALADTPGVMKFTHGTAAGNKVKVNTAKADIADVSYGDLDGIAMLEIPFTAVPSTAGNDELEIEFR